MKTSFASLTDIDHGKFDTVIDVRPPLNSPKIMCPARSTYLLERRTRLGQSIYERRHSRPKIGAALVARNVTFGWIPLKDITGSWRPLVYCWRGGQRSGSLRRS
jgi:tRNA 2-selenouridine synthase